MPRTARSLAVDPESHNGRRILGQVDTPAVVARAIARRALASLPLPSAKPKDPGAAILDPACGLGVFLDELRRLRPDLARIADQDGLYGVEVDPQRLAECRRVLGTAFPPDRLAACDLLLDPLPSGWPTRFAAIVGNPPYRRERGNAAHLARVAESPLGRWREPRMDLWYYFLHRALDLLAPGGIVSFIVSAYWLRSRGARRLIGRLLDETDLEELLLLQSAPVFPSVSGRHLIFRARRRSRAAAEPRPACLAARLTANGAARLFEESLWAELPCPRTPESFQAGSSAGWIWEMRPPIELLGAAPADQPPHGRRRASASPKVDPSENGGPPEGYRLESACVVRQGLAENPPRVTRAHVREFPRRWPLGAGVFVLTEEEWRAEQLDEDAVASAAARPYVPLAWVGRYRLGPPAGQGVPRGSATEARLLYLTPATAPALEPGTPLHRHLVQFLPLLERRREVQRGTLAWWHLHWPRREELFQQPRILAVQFGRRPGFVYAAEPTYVGFSINVIQARPEAACWSLPALTGILNSDRWAAWFARRAKQRGAGLEINGHLLRRVPLPDPDRCADAALARLVQQRQAAAFRDDAPAIERAIERLVEELRCRRLESEAE